MRNAYIVALVAAAIGCMFAAPAAAQAPPFFRYISVTTYNTSANVSTFAAWEYANMKTNCSKTYLAATTGINVNYLPKPNWGQFVKMIDFANLTAYTNYKTCDDLFVKKAFIGSFVTGKAHALVPAISTTKRLDTLPDNATFHVGLSNVTDTVKIITLRNALLTQFSGTAVINYLTAVFPTTSTVTPSNNHNHANVIATTTPHVNIAYYSFKNGNGGNVGLLPLYSDIKVLQPNGGRDTEFMGTKVK